MQVAGSIFVGDYLGCSGRVDFGAPQRLAGATCAPVGARIMAQDTAIMLVQRVRAGGPTRVLQPAPGVYLLLYGPVTGPVTAQWARRVSDALIDGRWAELALVSDELAGCLVTPGRVYLFRSAADSMEGMLYRRDDALLRWSTDPTELLDEDADEFDRQALWRCCRGDAVFIYHNLIPLLPGQLVIADANSTRTVQFDQIKPLDLPRRTPLPEYARLAHELILRAARPYVRCGRIGVMLSGGLDSITVLTALAEAGADVVAYHQVCADAELGEYPFARAACDHLGVPLVPIELDTGHGYLSQDWSFAHPYAHVGFRGMEQTAEQAQRDGLTFVTWGRDGDVVFGPVDYGVHTILDRDLPCREKTALARGLVCSGWTLPDLARSVRRSSSLLVHGLAIGDQAPPTDFLTPMPGIPDVQIDWNSDDYLVEEHATNLAAWWPRGIQVCSPLGNREIRRLVARMPPAYRMLPHRGRLITKPVLRLILSTRMPSAVWRRYGRGWFEMPHKTYLLNHYQQVADLIGGRDSRLVGLNLVDPARLAAVLANPVDRRRHAITLICAAMVELFLRSRSRLTNRPLSDHVKGIRHVPAALG